MSKKIPVKIGWELLAILFIPSFIIIRAAISNPKLETILLAVLFLSIIGIAVFGIKYKIKKKVLEITNLIFWKTKINIHEITKIEKTWNAISSPAPSLFGRVEIYYKGNSIVISPKNFEEFKKELLKINPKITVKN